MADGPPDHTAGGEDAAAASASSGDVIHHERFVAHGLAVACGAMGVTFSLASVAYVLGWAPGVSPATRGLTFVMAVFAIVIGLTATVLRTEVGARALQVSRGLTDRSIPIEAITACEVVPFAGHRHAGVELFAPTVSRDGVMVSWADGATARRALIASRDPARLAAAIERARAARAADLV